MKKAVFLLTFLFLLLPLSSAYADSAEKVDIVKFDTETYDMIVERVTGERLLIQHNRICRSMNIDFPVYLIWQGEKLVDMKVASNEQCKVYNWGPYTSEVKILSRTPSPSPFVAEHLAEIEWEGEKYEIDYGEGCTYLRDVVGQKAYLHTSSGTLNGAVLYLPNDRGQCFIKEADFLGALPDPYEGMETLTGIKFRAENNKAVFYWDALTTDENWVYLISRSARQIEPRDYTYLQMPVLRYSRENTYVATTLANNKDYYFYLSARNDEGEVLPWVELKVHPLRTVYVPENKPDPEPFEIFVKEEGGDYYLLGWPDKSAGTGRYLLQFFVDGRRVIFKIISGELSEYRIEKTADMLKATGYRLTLKSIAKKRFGTTYSDGHYWTREGED